MVDLKKSQSPDGELALALIEGMFFGYRDFVGIADERLAELGYGRAHHRVLHFVDRHPGLTVGELLGILKVTKQGVSRILKTLVDDGLIEVRAGEFDRREKRLQTTEAGHRLAREVVRIQSERIEAAIKAAGPGARETVFAFLTALVDDDDRNAVLRRIEGGR
ncbi:MarR family transcriptional regulator [Acuticoccus sediminis]|uniref:MarR family transcriptional regulator n=2 Tax=Acuticoccus sediminis TaxID=2184697 RepID=A0A8B2NQM6_9HYPH|nr:MarR family transcriptional regulator [Acuticoccus sediminis]